MAKEILKDFEYDYHPNGMHLWLNLPDNWDADEFVATAHQSNILITGYQPFVIEKSAPLKRVRISLGMESSRYRVKYALQLLADILSAPPPPTHILL